jgi:hypothetical protein
MVALLLLSLSVHASGIIAEMPNEGGGQISLTDIKCTTIQNTFIAYSNLPNGKAILGCWASDDDNVFVRWSNGDIRQYPIGAFTLKKRYSNGKWL